MTGTIFSVMDAKRWMLPMNTNPASTAMMMPTIQGSMENAVFMVAAMELDCTMGPMKPRAMMTATAKKPASAFPPLPLNAVVM